MGTATSFCERHLAYSRPSTFTTGTRIAGFLVPGLRSKRNTGLEVGPWKLAGVSSLCDLKSLPLSRIQFLHL